jgi:PAS fold/Methyl-accepting chemotaxis protein (MCP) signalling domain
MAQDGMGSVALDGVDPTEMIESIIGRLNGVLYRCRADEDFTMIFMSGGIYQLLGYRADEFVGNRTRTFSSVIHPADLPGVSVAVDAALAKRQPWNVDYRLVSADHKEVWVNEVGAGIFDQNGTMTFLEGALTAIHREKHENIRRQKVISEKSEEIVNSTGAIFVILSRLRMLAFNARIEAARAGDMGLGFTVVAKEINGLAEETSVLAVNIGAATSELRKLLSSEDGG